MELNEDNDNVLDKLNELMGESTGSLNILEEKIDIELQMEYFKFSKGIKEELDELEDEAVLERLPVLEDDQQSEDEIKEVLAYLAHIESPKAYRGIEKYSQVATGNLKDWAILALQENRMILESALLEESQVFISTGLGGRGQKLRYFIVFIRNDQEIFSEVQEKIIFNELDFKLKHYNSELEELTFTENFACMTVLLPLDVPIKDLFKQIIAECNEFGDFLRDNFIITNVKQLGINEIRDFVNRVDDEDEAEIEEDDDEEDEDNDFF